MASGITTGRTDVSSAEVEARRWMQRVISEVIDDPVNAESRLADLLVGIGLPPIGHAEEAYAWIARGVPPGAALPRTEARLGYLLGKILRSPQLRDPERAYNALRLAACLADPDHLCEPLHVLYDSKALVGLEYRGIPVTEALRGAIIENQLDDRYRSVWRLMYSGDGDAHLGGTPTSGFDGVLWMPPSAAERGTPDFEEIGRALGAIARDLEAFEYERPHLWRPEFQLHIDRARAAYPHEAWEEELLRAAHTARWPIWAVDALPQLCGVALESHRAGTQRIAVWDYFGAFVQDSPVVDRWCGGRIIVCDVPSARAEAMVQTLRPIDAARAQHDLASERSLVGVLMPEVARQIEVASAQTRAALVTTYRLLTDRINVGAGQPIAPQL